MSRTTWAGEKKAEGRPLNWYLNQGYSAEQVANIEHNCQASWDSQLGCDIYNLNVASTSKKQEEMRDTVHEYRPATETAQGDPPSPRARGSAPSPRVNKRKLNQRPSEDSHGQTKGRTGKPRPRRTPPTKALTKAQMLSNKKKARGVLKSATATKECLQQILKETAKLKEKIPPYMMTSLKDKIELLSSIVGAYDKVAQDGDALPTGTYSVQGATKVCKDADSLLDNALMMIELADENTK